MTRRALLLLALLVGACGGGDDDAADTTTSSSPGAGSGGATGVVSVQNSAFAPPTVAVKVGERVTWTFRDSFSHTATADDGSFDSGRKSGDATFGHTFDKAGSFTYKCAIHPSMTGTVTVS